MYPNVIKLHDIKVGKSNVDEIYMEYDLPSLLKSDTFEIKYFYAKGIKANDKDLQKLKQEIKKACLQQRCPAASGQNIRIFHKLLPCSAEAPYQ